MRQDKDFTYKGFYVGYSNADGKYQATAYANPQFESTSKADIKKQINKYLRS